MERELTSNIVEESRNLPAATRQWLEQLLGRELRDDEQVSIVVGHLNIPDPARRHRALAEIQSIGVEVEASIKERGITAEEVEAAIEEAIDAVRHRR